MKKKKDKIMYYCEKCGAMRSIGDKSECGECGKKFIINKSAERRKKFKEWEKIERLLKKESNTA